MKSKFIKITLMLIIILTIFSSNKAKAIKDPLEDPDYYDPTVISPNISREEPELLEMGGKILGVVNTIGVLISVVVLMILGIKYMVGSVQEKAEFKKAMMPYLIGAILLFAATTFPNLLYKISTSAFDETTTPSGSGGGGGRGTVNAIM